MLVMNNRAAIRAITYNVVSSSSLYWTMMRKDLHSYEKGRYAPFKRQLYATLRFHPTRLFIVTSNQYTVMKDLKISIDLDLQLMTADSAG